MSHNVILDFEGYLQTLKPATAKAYGQHLHGFYLWSLNPLVLPAGLQDMAYYYRNHLIYAGAKAATVNVKLSAIKGSAKHIGQPIEVEGVKAVRAPIDCPSDVQVNRLFRAVATSPRNVAIVALMARAGLRVGEVVGLSVGDITLNARSGQVLIRQGKGGKQRVVPLSLAAREALGNYPMPDSGLLFTSRSGGPLLPRDVQRLLQAVAGDIGASITPHQLRHYFATRFLQGGGDINTLAMLLGHSDIKTTAIYLHPNATQVAAMIEGL